MASRSSSMSSMERLGEGESGAMASAKKGDLMRRAWWAERVVCSEPEPMRRVMMGDLR